jgi:hypothetical protein
MIPIAVLIQFGVKIGQMIWKYRQEKKSPNAEMKQAESKLDELIENFDFDGLWTRVKENTAGQTGEHIFAFAVDRRRNLVDLERKFLIRVAGSFSLNGSNTKTGLIRAVREETMRLLDINKKEYDDMLKKINIK